VRVQPLTDDECTLLHDNDGCYKCHEPFTGHITSTCTNGFPDGATYKTLTAASVTAKKDKKPNTIASLDVKQTVAIVMPSAALGDGSDSDECVAPLILLTYTGTSC